MNTNLKKHVCIIEDEEDIIRLITYNLNKEGYKVSSLSSGENALAFVRSNKPDIILLDVMIPFMDGFEVCKVLKSDNETQDIPLIMISAKAEEANIVTGLELGADDYVTKPFSIEVLIARIRALLRRVKKMQSSTQGSDKEPVLSFGELQLYPDRYELYNNKTLVDLNHTEFKLLICLATHPGRVFSRTQIIDFLKGEDYYVTQRLVDVLLVSIRKKLGEISSCIQTVRGVGYKFKAPK